MFLFTVENEVSYRVVVGRSASLVRSVDCTRFGRRMNASRITAPPIP